MKKRSFISKLNPSPVIICGMHRSGTSLISRIISEMEIFMGDDIEVNNESLSFQLLNDQLLTLTHSYWDQIEGAGYFFRNEQAVAQATELIQNKYFNRRFLKGYFGKKTLTDLPDKWGWKDPRNTITFPLWMNIFKDAKIIFVFRNGIDSAASLVSREKKQDFDITIPAYSSRCRTIENAFSLWKDYNAFFINQKETLNQNNLLEIRYEDFLINPGDMLEQLGKFLQTKIKSTTKNKIIQSINSDRAYSFKGNKELDDFYSQVKDDEVMIALGYSKL